MKRSAVISMLLTFVGCFGGNESQDGHAQNGNDGQAQIADSSDDGQTSGDGEPVASDGSPPVEPADESYPPVAESEAVRRLREMASKESEVLSAATDYFDTTYDDRGVSTFLEHRNHSDAEVRRGAIYGLFTHFDPRDEPTMQAVQAALDDEDAVVRRVALKVMALPQFPRETFLSLVPRIAKHLDDEYEPDAATRAQVPRMLKRYTTSSQPALPNLDDALRNDPEFLVRSACLSALYDIAQTADEALPAPTYLLLNDPDPRLRRRAAMQLGKYKGGAAPAIDELIIALADNGVPTRSADDPLAGTDEPVCLAAANALARIGESAVGSLITATQSEDRQTRLLSIRALGEMGSVAKEATDRLQTLAQSPDAGEATAAKAALLRIGS